MTSQAQGDGSLVASVVTHQQLAESGFFRTALAERFRQSPIGVVDVGARWGVNEMFRPLAPLLGIVAFEPDAEEAKRIEQAEKTGDSSWAGFEISASALGRSRGEVDLHILVRPNNSSIYPVDPVIAKRYGLTNFDLVKKVKVPVVSLDELVFAGEIRTQRAGEMIKLDTQGAELDIILGAQRAIAERTCCLVCEAPFFTPYQGVELFSRLESELRAQGLTFYGFLDFKHRSTKRLDKRRALGRERVMQADALFFRDPLAHPKGVPAADPRQVAVAFTMALLFGYFDFCLEIIDAWDLPSQEAAELKQVIGKLTSLPPAGVISMVDDVHASVHKNPERAFLALGKLVDRYRDYMGYQDVPD